MLLIGMSQIGHILIFDTVRAVLGSRVKAMGEVFQKDKL
jgi:hypothetical protein